MSKTSTGEDEVTRRAEHIALIQKLNLLNQNSTEAQCKRMLERLRQSAIPSQEARKLGIADPKARAYELRHKYGYNIKTIWIMQPARNGRLRRIALFQLREVESNCESA